MTNWKDLEGSDYMPQTVLSQNVEGERETAGRSVSRLVNNGLGFEQVP